MMKASTLHVLIWTLIYGGLIGVGLGLSIQRSDAMLGWSFVAAGALASSAGVVLIWVRSRAALE